MVEITEVSYSGKKPTKRKGLKRTPLKRKSRKKARSRMTALGAKKDVFAALRAEYGLPEAIRSRKDLRYTAPLERGVLWYYFSLYIRKRDEDLPCINCGTYASSFHAGHYIPTGRAGWDGFVFDEMNVHAECANCNFRDKRKLKYGINLDKRYPGTREALESRYEAYAASQGHYKNWGREELRAKIKEYQDKYTALLKEV